MTPFITEKDIYDATRGGLDIILDLYPDAYDSVDKPNRKFKRRDEKTASSKLNRLKDGTYVVVDFGESTESQNAVKLYMKESNVDWGQAIKELATRYRVEPEKIKEVKASFSVRAAKEEDEEGAWNFDIRDSFTNPEIEYLLSKNVRDYLGWSSKSEDVRKKAYAKIAGRLKHYNCYPLVSYSIVKNRKVMTYSSSTEYPIFLIDEGEHKKIYQPKHPEKKFRFMYVPGSKPKDFIHGLKQLTAEYNKRKADAESEENSDRENEDRDNDAPKSKKKKGIKIPKLILCSGFSDGINVDLMGYPVIWLNSESAKLKESQHKSIMIMVATFYQLMDIDATGKAEAHERALEFLDIHNIDLPDSLLERRDSRGYLCKDVRDYMNLFLVPDFHKLVDTALPYQFWDEKYKYNRDNEFTGIDYDFNNVHAYNFLQKNGFYRLPVGNKVTDFVYIKINGNTVSETTTIRIKGFIKNFLRERSADVTLRNSIFRTTQLSDSSLTNLDEIELDFKDYTPFSQFMFFKNKTVEITKAGLKLHEPKTINRYIWEQDVYDHTFKPLDAPFEIKKDAAGAYDIEIKDDSCLFLRFLIQTSRIHWRTELEKNLESSNLTPQEQSDYKVANQFNIAGPLLSGEEVDEQKSHLLNKLFAMGYLLHRYKNKAKAWMVLGMDGKINHDGQAHGRSGKSIFMDMAMRSLLKSNFMLNGRDPKLDQNPHKYDGLTEHHRYIFIEDAHQYLNVDTFYTDITTDISVNPKGKQPYTVPFSKSGKFSMSTNFTITNLSPSTEGRVLYMVFGDYYHIKGETTDYREARDPSMEFGKQLFDDFTEDEWNLFYNTAAWALSFYLSTSEKITPAMDNVNTRNLMSAMGMNFYEWACTYFSEESNTLDTYIIREEAFKDFIFNNPKSGITSHGFKQRIGFFCRLNGYELNPIRFRGKQGNIIKKVQPKIYDPRNNVWTETSGAQVAKEHFYIETEDFDKRINEMYPEGYKQISIPTPPPAVDEGEDEPF